MRLSINDDIVNASRNEHAGSVTRTVENPALKIQRDPARTYDETVAWTYTSENRIVGQYSISDQDVSAAALNGAAAGLRQGWRVES
jgi:hypothetical protein